MSKDNTAVAKTEAQMPAFVSTEAVKGTGAGNENVGASDLQIPRLALLQDLSPEVNERKPEFIEGAKPGQILNKMTGELFDQVFVINLKYQHGYTAWKKRKLGGGLFGSFNNEEEAAAALEEAGQDTSHYDIVESPMHFVLLLDDEGKPMMPAILDMPITKAKVSRNWNSQITAQGDDYDRFAFVWLLGTKIEESNQGQEYFNYSIKFLGAAPEDLYEQAKKYYDQVKNQ